MEWIGGIMLGAGLFVYLWLKGDDTKCPNCGEDTVEVGYSGYKRKCTTCKWNNQPGERDE